MEIGIDNIRKKEEELTNIYRGSIKIEGIKLYGLWK